MPPFRARLTVTSCFTGISTRYDADLGLDTRHCGGYRIRPRALRVCDYLGLFAFPARGKDFRTVIRPIPMAIGELAALSRLIPRAWQPTHGFAEHHELRPYRPGDSLSRMHWKLSAKTGRPILRQPVRPLWTTALVTLNLRGTPTELDRKLGRLHWLGFRLLKEQVPFALQAMTGRGPVSFHIRREPELMEALDTLLCSPLCTQGDILLHPISAGWHYHIGGGPDE